MAFVFRAKKNIEVLPTKNDFSHLKFRKLRNINNFSVISKENNNNNDSLNNSSAPFLSKTEKFIDKATETPGPGYYNIENDPQNFIHKQYIKNTTIKYKKSIKDFYSFVNFLEIQKDNQNSPAPGPGEYDPGKDISFGGKIKMENKNKSFSLKDYNLPKIIYLEKINNKTQSNIKKRNKNRQLYKHNKESVNNYNNNDNLNLTKRNQSYTMKELFKNLLLNHKLRSKKNNNISYLKKSNIKKYISYNSNNSNNNEVLKKYNKSKIIKNEKIIEKLKQMNSEMKINITTKIQENNYYLNEFLKTKIFSESPGPGYYFFKSINNKKTNNIDYLNKSHSLGIINKNKLIKKDLLVKGEIKKINKRNNKYKKTKSIYQLKSDFIKNKFEKEQEIYNKNKCSILLNKLIKASKIKEKENQNILINSKNNIKEIQESEYPNFYKKNETSENNINNFISMEERFKGPSGYLNEIYKNNNPGPGQYQLIYNNISKINDNEDNIEKRKSSFDKSNINERKIFNDKIKNDNPPVGSYQSQLYNTIGLKNLMIIKKNINNPIKNLSLEKIKSLTERRIKYIKDKEKQSHSVLGPGAYFKSYDRKIPKLFKQSNFGSNSEKNINIKDNTGIRSGDYNIDLNKKWIKKTFNALFT